ncbi:MAG: oxidoreductase, partial [Candidatus Aenigmarchaeota archaeon]|nr:oxidoreductase [Candidatus Aenigmarchaeota archaeon]
GSIATLIHTSTGNKDLPKERIEISRGGVSCVITDFRELAVFGAGGGFKIIGQDKGQMNQLKAFANTIKGEASAGITLEECVLATKISFDVAKQIKEASE